LKQKQFQCETYLLDAAVVFAELFALALPVVAVGRLIPTVDADNDNEPVPSPVTADAELGSLCMFSKLKHNMKPVKQ